MTINCSKCKLPIDPPRLYKDGTPADICNPCLKQFLRAHVLSNNQNVEITPKGTAFLLGLPEDPEPS
jgi:hypothetical protein